MPIAKNIKKLYSQQKSALGIYKRLRIKAVKDVFVIKEFEYATFLKFMFAS
jgi:hypothetical protein